MGTAVFMRITFQDSTTNKDLLTLLYVQGKKFPVLTESALRVSAYTLGSLISVRLHFHK